MPQNSLERNNFTIYMLRRSHMQSVLVRLLSEVGHGMHREPLGVSFAPPGGRYLSDGAENTQ